MNAVTIDFRRATTADAAGIADVHMLAWQGAYAGIIPHRALTAMISRRGPRWWAEAVARSTHVMVVDAGGTIAGYATLGRNRARQLPQKGEIYELYLRPEWQGIGLGTRLFTAARQRLKEAHLKGLVVWALEENATAMSFYAGLGGRDVAEGVEIFDRKALRKIAFVWD
jgi:GNAT superfamily N-acetyltransferase